MQLRKQILTPVPFLKRRSTIMIAAIAVAIGAGAHIQRDLNREAQIETCAVGSYVSAIDANGVPSCAPAFTVASSAVQSNHGYAATRTAGANNLENLALMTDTGDVQFNEISGITTISGGTYTEATGELESYNLNGNTTLTGMTNSISKYAGTVWLTNSAITDDGTTVTVDLDQTDRTVVVKRPGTADTVTISKVPLVFDPMSWDYASVRSP